MVEVVRGKLYEFIICKDNRYVRNKDKFWWCYFGPLIVNCKQLLFSELSSNLSRVHENWGSKIGLLKFIGFTEVGDTKEEEEKERYYRHLIED